MPQSNNIQPGANHAVAVPSWAFKSDERKKFRRTKYKDKWSGDGVAKALRQVTVIKQKNDRSCEATARVGNASTTQPSLLYVRNRKKPRGHTKRDESTQHLHSLTHALTVHLSMPGEQRRSRISGAPSVTWPRRRSNLSPLCALAEDQAPAGVLSIIIYI